MEKFNEVFEELDTLTVMLMEGNKELIKRSEEKEERKSIFDKIFAIPKLGKQ